MEFCRPVKPRPVTLRIDEKRVSPRPGLPRRARAASFGLYPSFSTRFGGWRANGSVAEMARRGKVLRRRQLGRPGARKNIVSTVVTRSTLEVGGVEKSPVPVASRADASMSHRRSRLLRFHPGSQHGIDPGLIALLAPQPTKQVGVQPDRNGLLRLR